MNAVRPLATRFRHRLLSVLCVAAILLHTPALAAGAVDGRAAKGAQSESFRQSGHIDCMRVGRGVLVGGASELAFSGLLKLIGPGVGRVGAGSTRLIGHHSDDSLKALDDIARHADQADNTLGAACRTNSFIPSTLVLMADGSTKPIEDVQVGDLVEATDPETGEQGPRLVTDLIVGDGLKHLVDIDIDGETITATDRHPFWVDDEGRWVDAENLETGDRLLGADGTTVAVDRVSQRTEARRVHNLTVDGIHTYQVLAGEQPVLVHNCRIATNSGGVAGAVSDEVVRAAMQGAPLQTTQAGVSLPKIRRFVDRLRAGEVPPPIKVDGTTIVDGNRRYIASRIAGVDIEIQPRTGSPHPTVPWDDMTISTNDWGD